MQSQRTIFSFLLLFSPTFAFRLALNPTFYNLHLTLTLTVIMFFSTFFTAILLATATTAAPVNRPQELIVFSPHIISPQAAVAWPMGSRQTVKWGKCKTLLFQKIVLFY
jgi:hypothetical protein